MKGMSFFNAFEWFLDVSSVLKQSAKLSSKWPNLAKLLCLVQTCQVRLTCITKDIRT